MCFSLIDSRVTQIGTYDKYQKDKTKIFDISLYFTNKQLHSLGYSCICSEIFKQFDMYYLES